MNVVMTFFDLDQLIEARDFESLHERTRNWRPGDLANRMEPLLAEKECRLLTGNSHIGPRAGRHRHVGIACRFDAAIYFATSRTRPCHTTSSAPFVATLVDVSGLIMYFTAAAVILRGTLL